MVQTPWTPRRRRLWQINWHVGCSLHHVRIDRWKSTFSRLKLIGPALSHSKVSWSFALRFALTIHKKSKISWDEISLNSNFGFDWQKVFRKNLAKRPFLYQELTETESKLKINSKGGLGASVLLSWKTEITRFTVGQWGASLDEERILISQGNIHVNDKQKERVRHAVDVWEKHEIRENIQQKKQLRSDGANIQIIEQL